MEKFYLFTTRENRRENYIFGSFLREDQWGVDLLWIKEVKYHNYSTFSLSKVAQICLPVAGQELKNYFLDKNNYYSKSSYPDGIIVELPNSPGNFYPRIYRPTLKTGAQASNIIRYKRGGKTLFDFDSTFDYIPYEERSLISGVQQLKILIDKLELIFRNIYPAENNLKTYSDEIRNLIILSCTEVEAQLKGILRANGNTNDKLSTNDYVKLLLPLRLSAYGLNMSYFPSISFIEPFRLWNSTAPTKSLEWYDAYNEVKHDREKNFEKATLDNAIKSVAAVAVLLVAQYGYNIPYWKDIIGNFFEFTSAPSWNFEDCYLPPVEGRNWNQMNAVL